jgi:repressor LexA
MVEKGGDIMGFRVQGESMKDAYIQEGDVVVVKRTPNADPGEMVVAYLKTDGAITLKRLKKDNEKYWLVPENPEYQPIYDPFELVGKVVGVLRRYH